MLVEDTYKNVFTDKAEKDSRKNKCKPSTIDLEQYENYQLIKGCMDAYDCDTFFNLQFKLDCDDEKEMVKEMNNIGMDLFRDVINDTIDKVIHPDNKQYETVKQIIGDNNIDASDDDVEDYKRQLSDSVVDSIMDDDGFDPTEHISNIVDSYTKKYDTSKLYHSFIVSNDLELARPTPPPTNLFVPSKTYHYDGQDVNLDFINMDGQPKSHVEFKPSKKTLH